MNDQVPRVLRDTKGLSIPTMVHERVEYELFRDDIALDGQGDRLSCHMACHGQVTFKANPHVGPIEGPEVTQRVDFAGHVDGSMALKINADWSPDPDPQLSVTVDHADTRIFGLITINIRDLVQSIVNDHGIGPIKDAVRSGLAHMDTRNSAQSAWERLFLRKQILKEPIVWLTVQPKEVRVVPFAMDGGKLRTAISLSAATRVYALKEAPEINPGTLPNLITNPVPSDQFNVLLPIQSALPDFAAEANKLLDGKTFTAEGVKIRLSNVQLHAGCGKLIIGIDFKATHGLFVPGAKGRMYVVGTVHYDPAHHELSATDIDYTLDTKNALLKFADWILKVKFIETLSVKAQLAVDPLLADAKSKANEYLAELSPSKEVKVSAHVDNVDLKDVQFVADQAFVLVSCTGKSKLELHP